MPTAGHAGRIAPKPNNQTSQSDIHQINEEQEMQYSGMDNYESRMASPYIRQAMIQPKQTKSDATQLRVERNKKESRSRQQLLATDSEKKQKTMENKRQRAIQQAAEIAQVVGR